MATEVFNRKEAIKYGWEQAKKNVLFFLKVIGIMVVYQVLFIVLQSQFAEEEGGPVSLLLTLVSWVVQVIVGLGLVRMSLNILDGKKLTLSDLYSQYPYALKAIAGGILTSLIVLGGFVLLIVPGIIFSIKLQFVSYFILDKNAGPIDAIKQSWAATKGVKWSLFVFGILLACINILGMLALLIGLLWTYPLTLIATAYVYRKLVARGASASATAKTQEPPLVIPSTQASK